MWFPNLAGACLVNKKTASAMKPGSHGSIFDANPLAMAISSICI